MLLTQIFDDFFVCVFFHVCVRQEWDVERGLPRQVDPDAGSAVVRVAVVDGDGKNTGATGGGSSGGGGGVSVARRALCAAVKFVVIVAAITVTCAFVWYTMGLPFLLQVIVVAFIAFVASGGYKFIYLVYRTAPRDLK